MQEIAAGRKKKDMGADDNFTRTRYNGCVWKGGRLRLEKAKENFLDRLKREWAEDAQLASGKYTTHVNDDVGKELESLERPREVHSSRKKQLNIFSRDYRRKNKGGMTKEELDVMNSVMNKLFEMENISTTAHSDIELTKEEDYSMQVTNDPLLDESDGYSTADEDNLIINVVSRGQSLNSNSVCFLNAKESKLNKRKAPKDGSTEDMLEKQTRNHEENNENEYESAIARGKGNLQAHLNGSAILPGAQLIEPQSEQSKSDGVPNSINSKNKKLLRHENQRVQSDKTEVEELVEAQPAKMDSSSNKTGRGSAWLHKTSWTQLVNSNNGSSFSITQILPGVTFEKQELAKPHGVITTDARDHKNNNTIEKGKSESFVDGTMDLQIIRDCDVQKTVEPRQLHVLGSDNASASTENKQNSATKRPRKGDIVIGETCSFMRTDASLKEWANAKAALSGSRNRTSKGKKMLTSH
ncbi:hypothetical protein GH714_042460 [Hevea brasiliensis]|uniref:Uncharacterized protein n=1 Tax=Hevea brasiliensis TaxID=3981 RepID=A0A6A6KVA0_HEVBR|nr:hypothetical protein GH714_042460 [Hevea brasiliensis]